MNSSWHEEVRVEEGQAWGRHYNDWQLEEEHHETKVGKDHKIFPDLAAR